MKGIFRGKKVILGVLARRLDDVSPGRSHWGEVVMLSN
jgi:hypothetical protein